MVYKVLATEFLPLRERPLHDQEEDTYLALLKTTIKTGPMYFSYSYDITNTCQRQSQHDLSLPLWKRADDRFFWNRFIQSDLINFSQHGTRHQHGPQPGVDPYILPVMFGMMEIVPTSIKMKALTLVLITRRSRHRAGTRYFTRGIDENGNVSNYNETEQIMLVGDSGTAMGSMRSQTQSNGRSGGEIQITSYVQTRGSVPVYWAEINTLRYTPKLQVRSVDSSLPAARKHFDEQIDLYGDNYLVNLVNQKGREKRVKDAYESLVKTIVSAPREAQAEDEKTNELFHVVESNSRRQRYDRLHYVYFDFHNETKGLKWYRAQLLLDQMKDALDKQQYFRGIEMPALLDGRLEARSQQTSVVRTNCMDCLDRTNVVQSMLARQSLNRQMIDLGMLDHGDTFTSDLAFEFLFRKLWADNADVVSRSYSGTGALKTDFTRTGNRTRTGALQDAQNSVTRYVRNNFMDGPKQDGFDLFLGAYTPNNAMSGEGGMFADQRPLLIQSIPYIFFFSLFFLLVGAFSKRLPDAAVLPLRIFQIVWLIIGGWCGNFIFNNGMLYVGRPISQRCKV